MTEAYQPGAGTLLPLLEGLINGALARRPPGGRISPTRVDLEPGAVTIELAFPGWAPLVKEGYRLRLRLEILSTSPERTVCAWHWDERRALARGIARLVGKGVALLPRDRLDPWMERFLGEGVRLEGERLVIEHAVLIRRLLG